MPCGCIGFNIYHCSSQGSQSVKALKHSIASIVHICTCFYTVVNVQYLIGGGVNIDRSKLSWFHLTQHSLAHLVMFYILGFAYGWKLPPRTAKTVFANPKAPPFGFEKIFFLKSPKIIFLAKPFDRNSSHDSKKVWHLGIRNIFGNIFLKNIFKNIFSKNIYKNIFNTQVLYHFGILRPIPIEWLC